MEAQGEHFEMPLDLTKEETLQVGIILGPLHGVTPLPNTAHAAKAASCTKEWRGVGYLACTARPTSGTAMDASSGGTTEAAHRVMAVGAGALHHPRPRRERPGVGHGGTGASPSLG
jgi:hypothetical protein